jgi:hypothetical protein
MDKQNCLWKQRYEMLKQFLADAEFDIRDRGFEAATKRAWDAPETVCVSFAFDVCSDEDTAIKLYGAGKYDVYTLKRRAEDAPA